MNPTVRPPAPSGSRPPRPLRRLWPLAAALLLLAACASPQVVPPPSGSPEPLDPDVLPVSGGAWAQVGTDTRWQWQLQGAIDDSYDVDLYDIDLFDASKATIASLQAAGRTVICYFSAGSFEEWRPDADAFDSDDLGRTLSGFADERWLDIRSTGVQAVMLDRLDRAVAKGCDGVEPDNVQSYLTDTGFDLSARDQLAFNRFLFNAAHERGLAVALKNGLGQIPELIDYVDFAVNEQCHEFDECDAYQPFLEAGKAVLNAEYLARYRSDPGALCTAALQAGLRTVVFDEDLDDSFRYSCDDDFVPASTTRLAEVASYTTYYGRDAARLADLTRLDLAVVQPVLTGDQIAALTAGTQATVYLSIGEIGLSNSYWQGGEEVLGQVIYDAHPEWFLARNPNFDSWFADTNRVGWQDFVLEQAAILLAQGYHGLFLDTVDTVDVYPDTIPGMVALIGRLRSQHPDAILVQNRGITIIEQSGADVDALMFEVFSSRYDFGSDRYTETDTAAPGYAGLVEKALAYRLGGGVVLAQDFAEPAQGYDDLICYARDRALRHHFLPAYADKFFQGGRYPYPDSCPYPGTPDFRLALSTGAANVAIGRSSQATVTVQGLDGFDTAVSLRLGATPSGVDATLGSGRVATGADTTLTLTATAGATAGRYPLTLEASGGGRRHSLRLTLTVHDQSVWVTNAGLSDVVVYDAPAALSVPAPVARRSSEPVQQPYALTVDPSGYSWVVANVGDPNAAQPAGRLVRYAPFDLSAPDRIVEQQLNYPTGIALAPGGDTLYVANSALDWTGTPRGTPSIAAFDLDGNPVAGGFEPGNAAALGYPKQIALDAAGDLWMTTTYGLVLGFDLPAAVATPAPFAVIAGVGGDIDGFDVANALTFDGDGNLWVSGSLSTLGGAGRVVRIDAGSRADDGSTTMLTSSMVGIVLSDGLFGPYGLAFAADGALWLVNSTDAADDDDSRGSLLRYDAGALSDGASPSARVQLASRYTLGIAVARP